MKMKKIYILFMMASLTLMSCESYLEEAFKNPNSPTKISSAEALPSIIANLARGIQFDSRFLGRYVQNWTITGPGGSWDRQGYDPNSDNAGEKWRSHYFAIGQNAKNMIRDAKAEGKPEYAGAGFAIFAFSWLQLTDYHGDVILKQAFDTERLTFDYESQEDVYKYVAVLCDSADFYINQAKQKSVSADFANADKWLFNGNIDQWKQFVSGVRAKLAHRYSLKSTYKADDVIKFVDASFPSTAVEASIKFNNGPADASDANFYGPRRNNMGAYRPTDFTIRLMDGTVYKDVKDPRMAYLFRPSDDLTFRGLTVNAGEVASLPLNRKTYNFFGVLNSTIAPAGGVDANSRTFFKNNAPFPIMTRAELLFIKAEAQLIKKDNAGALKSVEEGIKANFEMYRTKYTGYKTITDEEVSTYITSVLPATAADLTIKDIMVQKYLALWGWGFEEIWVDLRKHKYNPEVFPTWKIDVFYPDNLSKTAQRVRPRYNSEYLWNVEALKKVKGTDTDYHTIDMWFSKP
jgi:Starch-binding associating with outer membrane